MKRHKDHRAPRHEQVDEVTSMDFGCTGEMTELTIHMGYAQLKCLHVKLMLKARLATTEKLQQMLTERTHRPPRV